METNTKGSGNAIISLLLGLLGIIAWIIPLIGLPITVIGLILGIIGLRSRSRGVAIAGITLCSLFLAFTIVNASIGSYLGATGQHQFLNSLASEIEIQNKPLAPTRLPTRRPSKTPVPGATRVMSKSDIRYTSEAEEQSPSDCTLWSSVTLTDVGKNLCVYGVIKHSTVRDDTLYLTFSNKSSDFFFVHYGGTWFEGVENNCAMAEGKIQQIGGSPVIVINQYDLYFCE